MVQVYSNRYSWRKDERVPSRMKREVGGGELIEDVWNFLNHGEQNLFLGLYTRLSQPVDTTKLLELLRKSWISLRWDVPTIAARILHEPREGQPSPAALLTYDLPSAKSDVEAWVDRTVILKNDYEDLDALRYEVGRGLLPSKDLEPQTFLYVLPLAPDRYGLLIRTSHVPFDGAGVKILASKLLEHLSKFLSDPDYASAEKARCVWGTESEHLLPIMSEVLRKHEPAQLDAQGNTVRPEMPEVPIDGPEYKKTLDEVMQGLAQGAEKQYPFKSLRSPPYGKDKDLPRNRRAFHTFSVDESRRIMAARLGDGSAADRFTVTHIVHGALCLLTVMDNSPGKGSTNTIYTLGVVDCRKNLTKEYRGPEGYPGYCLGASAIQVPVSIVDRYAEGLETNTTSAVLDFARAVREEYRYQASLPALASIANEQVELLVSAPEPSPWCGPCFSSDGCGENYLRPRYSRSGPTVIEVSDFFLGLNKTDPGPFFRVTEWRGCIMLSADYNELAVEPAVVSGWIKTWAELIRSITC